MTTSLILRKAQLDLGLIETKNLTEACSVNIIGLIQHLFPQVIIPNDIDINLKITQKMVYVAQIIYKQFGFTLFSECKNHASDMVRGIGCYLLALHSIPLVKKLDFIYSLADDPHFGVREWSWIALRKDISEDISHTISLLQKWAQSDSVYIRRFASEATRPRGVWSKHIQALKKEPWLGIPLLEILKSDPERYVQLSVGNWLNDAGKDHPEWVETLCEKWMKESKTLSTQKICTRALRNISKKRE